MMVVAAAARTVTIFIAAAPTDAVDTPSMFALTVLSAFLADTVETLSAVGTIRVIHACFAALMIQADVIEFGIFVG